MREPLRISREHYDALAGINWSTLKLLGKSPAHYLHRMTSGPSGDTDSLQRGRAVHVAVFEPERYLQHYVVYEGRRAGKEWDAFEARYSSREVITASMNKQTLAIAGAARADKMAAPYLAGGIAEASLSWRYDSPHLEGFEDYKFDCKGRLDFIVKNTIVDLKTTKDASPRWFQRACADYEYHVQAAFYVDGCEAMTGMKCDYVIVAVETTAPYVVQVYRVPDDLLQLGRERYRDLLARLNVCRRESRWPGYADSEMPLEIPRWARPVDAEDDFEDAGLIFGG